MPARPAQTGRAVLDGFSDPTNSNIQVRSARLADRQARLSKRPVALVIPAIGVRAAVNSVGTSRTGDLEIPTDVRMAGWFEFGPSPGEPGSAVIVGHVDSAAQGRGVFFRLRELGPGSTVTIRFDDGTQLSFRVVGRRSYPKTSLPPSVFARSGTPVLTLITCGGAFDWATHHYKDNVVVYAVPVS
jgi:sortase (surface protein transpeptidase)